jgi:hypothetical protein
VTGSRARISQIIFYLPRIENGFRAGILSLAFVTLFCRGPVFFPPAATHQNIFRLFFFSLKSGLPDFSWDNIPKRGKIYQITIKCTKLPQDIPKCCQIFQMDINYTNSFHSKALQNLDFWFENIPSGNPAYNLSCALKNCLRRRED